MRGHCEECNDEAISLLDLSGSLCYNIFMNMLDFYKLLDFLNCKRCLYLKASASKKICIFKENCLCSDCRLYKKKIRVYYEEQICAHLCRDKDKKYPLATNFCEEIREQIILEKKRLIIFPARSGASQSQP